MPLEVTFLVSVFAYGHKFSDQTHELFLFFYNCFCGFVVVFADERDRKEQKIYVAFIEIHFFLFISGEFIVIKLAIFTLFLRVVLLLFVISFTSCFISVFLRLFNFFTEGGLILAFFCLVIELFLYFIFLVIESAGNFIR